MTRKLRIYSLSTLLIIILFAMPVKADPVLVVGQKSPITYDVYLCHEKSAIDNIVQAQKDMNMALTQMTMKVYAMHGACNLYMDVYIKVNKIYDTFVLDYYGEKQRVTVVHLQTGDEESFYGVVPSDHLGIRPI